MRGWQADLHRLIVAGNVLKTYYDTNISSVMTALTNGTVIPNSSGLAGSIALTDTEVVNLQSHINAALTELDTTGHRQLRSKAAGINAGG